MACAWSIGWTSWQQTCPRDAAAMGCSEMELKTSAMGRPSSSSMILKACMTQLPLRLQAHVHITNGCNAALPGDAPL